MPTYTNRTIGAAIARREVGARNSTGSLQLSSHIGTRGWLSSALIDRMVKENPTDIVYSYDTPIAWYGAQGWVVPKASYSATTSRHQGIVRRAVGIPWDHETEQERDIN